MTHHGPTSEERDCIRAALLAFFAAAHRDLPWRHDRDPYRVLVSEVMLQQTRAETVAPYFHQWLERFPDAEEVAKAREEEVLRLWQGLGYYSRARNLHSAVREIASRFEGRIPSDPQTLETLPGVGPYTAGAVASIAFGVPVPAVDGNVRRVLSRLMDDPAPSPATLRGWAASLVDPANPGDFNQALMELGSQICTPRKPNCAACPIGGLCRAKRAGTQEGRPAPRPRRPMSRVVEALAVLVCETERSRKVLLRKRPRNGLLGGMWELPGAQVLKAQAPEAIAVDIAVALTDAPAVAERLIRRLTPVDHVFTHRRLRYLPFIFSIPRDGGAAALTEDRRWVDHAEADRLPISAGQLRVLNCVF